MKQISVKVAPIHLFFFLNLENKKHMLFIPLTKFIRTLLILLQWDIRNDDAKAICIDRFKYNKRDEKEIRRRES